MCYSIYWRCKNMPRKKANGEGSIIKLPNGKYKGVMTVEVVRDIRNKVIKQKRKTFTHEKKYEVQKWLNGLINDKNKDILVSPNDITVKKWINTWLDKYKKNSIKVRSYEGYKTIIDNYIEPTIGKIKLQDLKTVDIQDVLNGIIESGKSARTAEYTYVTIHAALKQAMKENYIPRNVSEGCKKPKKEKLRNYWNQIRIIGYILY